MRYFVYCRKSSEAEDRQILSIDSQKEELRRAFEKVAEIEIVGAFEEAFSAKAPGRKVFDEMLRRIEKGEAEGIITWHPDRLARNSVDGGRIIYLLDRKILKELKFATFTFENNSQGKFMLSIIFGYSKYYVDSLSENVKRGNRAKIRNGWLPNMPPIGYLNDRTSNTIIKDTDRFPIVRKLWEMMLSGAYSPHRLHEIARDELGLRTLKRKRVGGKPITRSALYKIFAHPFYAGMIPLEGSLYPGKHEPVVTLEEFKQVQQLLRRASVPRAKGRTFAFTGLIRCGECGAAVTAEEKVNRYGRQYTYYHCTKRRPGIRCTQPSIEVKQLEGQIRRFLTEIGVGENVLLWTDIELGRHKGEWEKQATAIRERLSQALADTRKQLDTLVSLRIRDLLSDGEFASKRSELQLEERRLAQSVENSGLETADWFEPLKTLISFRYKAVSWFSAGDHMIKRLIVDSVCSNLYLTDKKLSVEARKPFCMLNDCLGLPDLWAVMEDVRTLAYDDDWVKLRHNLSELNHLVEARGVSDPASGIG